LNDSSGAEISMRSLRQCTLLEMLFLQDGTRSTLHFVLWIHKG
jgi:hypothetical protein